jgi:hypothetical protein
MVGSLFHFILTLPVPPVPLIFLTDFSYGRIPALRRLVHAAAALAG